MPIPYSRKLIPYAVKLRKNATPQENKLWYQFLSKYPIRFQRQKTIDSFIVDFYCYRAKLIIEVDGEQHFTQQGIAYDQERSAILERYGLHVLRFSNMEIDRSFNSVCQHIDFVVKNRLETE